MKFDFGSDNSTGMTELKPFISKSEIESIVADLGKKISHDYKDKITSENKLIFIVTLKGAFLFAADLFRHVSLPFQIDFTRVSSYGSGSKSSGQVALLKEIETSIENHHVVILDEIIDTGRTIHFLQEKYSKHHPKSLAVCSLLDKPSRREVEVKVDYIGKKIEDRFVVGYGLDYQENYRGLADIFELSL